MRSPDMQMEDEGQGSRRASAQMLERPQSEMQYLGYQQISTSGRKQDPSLYGGSTSNADLQVAEQTSCFSSALKVAIATAPIKKKNKAVVSGKSSTHQKFRVPQSQKNHTARMRYDQSGRPISESVMIQLQEATRNNQEHILPPAFDTSARYRSLQATSQHSNDHSADDNYYLNPPETVRASPLQPLESLLSPDKVAHAVYEQDYASLVSPEQLPALHRQTTSSQESPGRWQAEPPRKLRILAESPAMRPVVERNRPHEMYAMSLDMVDQR